jgi:hypothetical protein
MTAWTNADIDFARLDVQRARADESLMSLVAGASLVESASDLYTSNLVEYFKDDPEVAHWLKTQWEPEELQHGRALRAYIARVWPSFDWEQIFRAFLADYGGMCLVETLRPTPALEMVARCVVETGTATLYEAIASRSQEPVLNDIVMRIRQDEIRHFKHFYRYFRKYQRGEQLGRLRVARALVERVAELRSEDAACALRHVFIGRYPDTAADTARVESWIKNISSDAKRGYPFTMAAKMLITPLDLHPWVKPWLGVPVAMVARMVVWGL